MFVGNPPNLRESIVVIKILLEVVQCIHFVEEYYSERSGTIFSNSVTVLGAHARVVVSVQVIMISRVITKVKKLPPLQCYHQLII